jgi:Zn-dependent alcohol dehydrogenase
VGLHLKTCCAVLEGGRLNPEQFKQCLDKVSAYDKQIVFITQQVTEAAQAREQGATDVVHNKVANIDQAIQTATNTAENFVRQVEQIRPPGTTREPDIGKDGSIGLETEPNNTAAQATELRLSGEITGDVSTKEDPTTTNWS